MKSITITLALMGILAGGCTTSATVPETKEPEKETPSQQEENIEKETTEMTNPFNFETKTVKLNSGWDWARSTCCSCTTPLPMTNTLTRESHPIDDDAHPFHYDGRRSMSPR